MSASGSAVATSSSSPFACSTINNNSKIIAAEGTKIVVTAGGLFLQTVDGKLIPVKAVKK
jgi:hypothetical protein